MKELNKTLNYMRKKTPISYKHVKNVNKLALSTLLNVYDLNKESEK